MSPQLRLYNTLTRTKEVFTPIDPLNVRMYVCGPTVYDYAHIGNARPVIVFDVLNRLLRHLYGDNHVTYARNLTDVDDKINARAARDFPGLPLNEAIARVTQATTAQFHADVAALGCLPPTVEPRATGHIEEMKAIIYRLHDREVAYVEDNHVLFSPEAMDRQIVSRGGPRYGALARRSLDEMIAGARVDVAPYKRGSMDFVLWKPSYGDEPGWPSPLNIRPLGRPGWHIECSAMSMATLLKPIGGGLQCDDPTKNVFDIHGGGIDLVFPHHENEIAQSCCAFDTKRMANYWMHNGFLQVEGEKMSKSLGNFVTINELLETESFGGRRWPGEVLRLAMLKTHYRQPIDWTVKALEEAEKTLESWASYAAIADQGEVPDVLLDALADDLNTPKAIAECFKLISTVPMHAFVIGRPIIRGKTFFHKFDIPKKAAIARGVMMFLGLDGYIRYRSNREDEAKAVASKVSGNVETLIAARLAARRAKNFAESDRIRDELAAMGIALKDGKDPATGEPTTTWEVRR